MKKIIDDILKRGNTIVHCNDLEELDKEEVKETYRKRGYTVEEDLTDPEDPCLIFETRTERKILND